MEPYLPDDEFVPAPNVPEWLLWIWRAFHRLSVDRKWVGGGMSGLFPAPISWKMIVEWCEYHGYCDDDFRTMDACIRAMDMVFINHHAKKAKEAMPTK